MDIDDDLARMQHPVAGSKELIRSHDAHRHDGRAKFVSETEDTFLERLHMASARA
jgi:hypothetical protein